MRLKNSLKAIKAELNTEERFIESFIKGEKFIRKYKVYILIVLTILAIWLIGAFINSKFDENKIKTSNEIYMNLLQNPNDKNLLEKLKDKNANLYTIFLIKENITNPNNKEIENQLKQISGNTQVHILLKNIVALSLNEKSIFLKNYDKLIQAYKLLDKNNIKEANVILSQIKDDSSFSQIAKNLKHYQGISQ